VNGAIHLWLTILFFGVGIFVALLCPTRQVLLLGALTLVVASISFVLLQPISVKDLFAAEDSAAWINTAAQTVKPRELSRFTEGGPLVFAFLAATTYVTKLMGLGISNTSLQSTLTAWSVLLVTNFALCLTIMISQVPAWRLTSVKEKSLILLFSILGVLSQTLLMQRFIAAGWLSAALASVFCFAAVVYCYSDAPLSRYQVSISLLLAQLSWWPFAIIFLPYAIVEGGLILVKRRRSLAQQIGSLRMLFLFCLISVLCTKVYLRSVERGTSILKYSFSLGEISSEITFARIITLGLSVIAIMALALKQPALTLIPGAYASITLLKWLVPSNIGYGVSKVGMVVEGATIGVGILETLRRFNHVRDTRSRRLAPATLAATALVIGFIVASVYDYSFNTRRSQPSLVKWQESLVSDNPSSTTLCLLSETQNYHFESYVCTRFWSSSTGDWNEDTADWAQGLAGFNDDVADRHGVRDLFLNPKLQVLVDDPNFVNELSEFPKYTKLLMQHDHATRVLSENKSQGS